MARELVDVQHNTIRIADAISGGDLVLHYRLPTTEERVAYQRACLHREGKKVSFDAGPARIKYGLKILTGFREGDFSAGGKPISADPKAENYRDDWKSLVEKTASDIVAALAIVVFEGLQIGLDAQSASVDLLDEADGSDGGEGAELPLQSS